MDTEYKICSVTVMDTIANPDIKFNEIGRSNYFHEYHEKSSKRLFNDENELNKIVNIIKNDGKGKDYDCIIGVSGGVDSTYVAFKVKELGLRPMAVHFDNGWNSELAVMNIEKTLKKLDIDLITFVINWEEFKSLQLAFLKSSTPDGEIPTDHAILSLLFKIASEKGIKYIISGSNFATEFILPQNWAYGHIDWTYIKGVNKLLGKNKLHEYPHLTPIKYFYYTFFKQIKLISILNYLNYNKDEAMNIISSRLDWRYYGGKHYESVYTRFYQGFILPKKFGIDKRKAHLSTLILSGQISREKALDELRKPIYPEELEQEDKIFVMKKFQLTTEEFEKIMSDPPKTFRDYPNNLKVLSNLRRILYWLRLKKIIYS